MHLIRIGIVDYSGALQSAVQGLKEMFFVANSICAQQQLDIVFEVEIYNVEHILALLDKNRLKEEKREGGPLQVVILPPCLEGEYYFNPDQILTQWLQQQHAQGAILCSVCAGAFILASSGLLVLQFGH